jgi:hypothetical protein
MSEIVVLLRSELIDELLPISDEIISAAFLKEVRSINVSELLNKVRLRNPLEEGSQIRLEVVIDIGDEQELLDKFKSQTKSQFEPCASQLLEDLVRNISSDLSIEDISPYLSRADLGDIDSLDENVEPSEVVLSECCGAEAFDDGEGLLFCPECGACLLNLPIGPVGCPACGSIDIDSGGHCEVCFAYAGKSIAQWDARDAI